MSSAAGESGAGVGRVYPSEKREFVDSDTGAEITQYTQAQGVNRTLYFTNRPYANGGESIVFLSNRTGRNEIFMVERRSGRIVQLTDVPDQLNLCSCVHPTRPEVYFHDTRTLYRVRLDTLVTEPLFRVDDRFGMGILNLNSPPWIALSVSERAQPVARTLRTNADAKHDRWYRRPLTLIYRYNIDADLLDCVWSAHKQLTHVQVSPVDPDLMVFSSWLGYGDARCYALDLHALKRSPRAAFPETATARAGHESFTRSGVLYAQWMEGDFSADGDKRLYHAFLVSPQNARDGFGKAAFRKYAVPESRSGLAHHFTMSSDERWGAHERWLEAPSWPDNLNHLSVFRHQAEPPQSQFVKLCRAAHISTQDRFGMGPDMTLDNDDCYATYTHLSNAGAQVCQVRVTPFVDRLMTP